MIWTGEGSNGKGVAIGILTALVGEENTCATDITKLDNEYNRAALRDKLLGISTEVPTRALIDDNWFKAFVAGDPIAARLPYGRPFTFRPYVRLLITCNALPTTRDQSYAFFRRLIIVPWQARIDGESLDTRLEDALRETELPGIFLWAVQGLARLEAARWRFTPADAASRALEEYRLEGNSVALWAAERTVPDPNAIEPTDSLYKNYTDYCTDSNLKPYSKPHFGRQLRGVYPTIEKADDRNVRGWRGIRLAE
jgi:putative DNA primase/helicase